MSNRCLGAALIRQGMFTRKQSIDLLDGLDLDFLNVDSGTGGGLSSYEGDFGFGESHYDDHMDMNLDLFRTDDAGLLDHDHADGLLTDRSIDRDWFMRRMSIGSEFGRGRSGTTDWQLAAQGISLSDTDRIAADMLNSDWGAGNMGSMNGVVDMSAYETVAANLQTAAETDKAASPPQVLRINKVCFLL
jgi:hypothetical protein